MDNHNPTLAYRSGKLEEVGGRLVVPARGNGLQDEAAFLEVGGVRALPYLVGGQAVAVCGEGLDC
jgi:hypothetical protein